MKKNKSSIQIIELNVFPYDIMVAIDIPVEKITHKLKRFGVKLTDEQIGYLKSSGLAHTIKLPNKAVLIYFVNKPSSGIIAHEVFHAVWMILATMGVEPSVESEEVYAYMIEYIVNQINKSPLK
jgi:hypothetical protein